jgi:tripartite-type tricarboxylate transporter receptor subunit TctC
VTDFSPISLASKSPNILAVHPSLPSKSVKELIGLAKAKPGQLNYASTATGGANHLSAELFKAMAGVNIVRIAYRGTGPALTALISGEVHLTFTSATAVAPHIKAGRLRGLAVTSAEPTPLAPGLPTVAASGIPGYEVESTDSILGPARMPPPIIKRLNQEIVRVLNQAEIKAKFLNAGVEAAPSSPEQLAATIKSEMAKWGKLIRDAGIQGEQ